MLRWSENVDIFEFEITLEQRRDVEEFVVQFFKGWANRDSSQQLVEICENLVDDVRITNIVNDLFVYATRENFNESYAEMCRILFDHGAEIGHVVSLLAFSIVLDRTMQEYTWYSSQLVYRGLIEALIEAGLKKSSWGEIVTIELIKTITGSLIILLPSLLFYYFASKC